MSHFNLIDLILSNYLVINIFRLLNKKRNYAREFYQFKKPIRIKITIGFKFKIKFTFLQTLIQIRVVAKVRLCEGRLRIVYFAGIVPIVAI